jgi:glycosyltransferase involved in cell wall biosynthesis
MISVAVIVKNEEENLPKMLQSIAWADEIIIVDTGSQDNTIAIAQQAGCRVFQSEWLGFGKCKQLAVEHCSHKWILSLDADEVVTAKLQEKIRKITESEKSAAGYRIKRKSFYLNQMINHCGWNNDYTLRLFQKDKGKFNEKMVHESVQIDGEIGYIHEHLLHYTYPTINSHLEKMFLYSSLASTSQFKKGKKSTLIGSVCKANWKFCKMYIFQLGFLDGRKGFLLCYNSAMGVFWKYAKLWELKQK